MMSGRAPLYWTRRILAVDHGDGTPVVVRAQRGWGRVRCQAVDGDRVLEQARCCNLTVGGLKVGIGLSAWLGTPFRGAGKVRRVLPSVLDTRLPFPLEECMCSFGSVLSGKQACLPIATSGSASLAIVGRKCDLVRLEGMGLEPDAFVHEGLALWAGLAPSHDKVMRVIVWCRTRSLLLVLGVGDVYWSSHYLEDCSLAAVQRVVGLQRQTTCKGVHKDVPIVWYIGGQAAAAGALRDALERLDGMMTGACRMLPDGPHYLARLLAESVLLPGRWRFLPLFTDAGMLRRARALRCYRLGTIALCFGCGLLLAGILYVRHHIGENELAARERTIQQMVRSVTGFVVAARGRDAFRIAEQELDAQRAAITPVLAGRELSELGGAIAAVFDKGNGGIERMSLMEQEVLVQLWLPAGNRPDGVIRVLEDSGYGEVLVEKEETGGDNVRYTFRAVSGGAR